MSFSEFIKDLSIIVASCTAIYGIGSWRREYIGKKQTELAEEVLCLFYEARDAVQHIRNPFSHGNEGSSRKADENETPEQKEACDRAYVLFERFNTHIELFNKMHSIRYRFMAQFGGDTGKPFDDFRRILNTIQASSQALAIEWAKNYRHFRTEKQETDHDNFIKEQENIFWEGLPEEDTIKPKVAKCIDDIEKICRPIIDNRSVFSLVSKINLLKKLNELMPDTPIF
ncbi:MAG TPA: hypothetical protein ACFYEF_06350 [Candidatus Wunengus sp. YC63]|uniref:hypothetical protein n=1 Tax=Candidatus Wunengus sp. YC63 TaxID=3367699 RepID=UPI002713B5E2|nr:hypothetical protein [Candidatus Brocadiales bacterium]